MPKRTLTLRERALILGAAIIFVSLIVVPIARAFARNYDQTKADVHAAALRLRDARELRETILEQREAQRIIAERVGRQGERFNLYDYTNSTLARVGLRDRMQLEKKVSSDRLDVVRVTLNNVSLQEFVDLLHTLGEGGHLVTVQNLTYLRPAPEDKGLECSMLLAAPRV